MHRIAVAALFVALLAVGLAACSDAPARPHAASSTSSGTPSSSGSASNSSTASTSGTSSTASSTSNTVSGSITASLHVVVCPTTYGVTSPSTTSAPPSTEGVVVPRAVAGQLAIYTDQSGYVKLLAPAGWICRAEYGADGSGGVAVFPSGETAASSAFGGGWKLTPTSRTEAVVGSQTGGCAGCAVAQACPLFPAAASAYVAEFARPCPQSRPDFEAVENLNAETVAFMDPSGRAGDGEPSGGLDGANGVMLYDAHGATGSWLDTCTLPPVEVALCTAALNTFVEWYGAQ